VSYAKSFKTSGKNHAHMHEDRVGLIILA